MILGNLNTTQVKDGNEYYSVVHFYNIKTIGLYYNFFKHIFGGSCFACPHPPLVDAFGGCIWWTRIKITQCIRQRGVRGAQPPWRMHLVDTNKNNSMRPPNGGVRGAQPPWRMHLVDTNKNNSMRPPNGGSGGTAPCLNRCCFIQIHHHMHIIRPLAFNITEIFPLNNCQRCNQKPVVFLL